MNVQIVSDLHLEIAPSKFKSLVTPSSDILVLAGNIGIPFRRVYSEFLKWCSRKFKYVVLVTGNHEYHGSSIRATHKKIRQIIKNMKNIVFLDNSLYQIPNTNTIILGSTLWSHIPKEKKFETQMKVNDFMKIRDFTPEIHNTLHSQSKTWLRSKIEEYSRRDYIIVIVTHHSPVRGNRCIPEYEEIVGKTNLWISGHTHFNIHVKHKKCTLTSNQRGYPLEDTNYKKNFVVNI